MIIYPEKKSIDFWETAYLALLTTFTAACKNLLSLTFLLQPTLSCTSLMLEQGTETRWLQGSFRGHNAYLANVGAVSMKYLCPL